MTAGGQPGIRPRRYDTQAQLVAATVQLLREAMQQDSEQPFGIMLSGGSTPLPVYAQIERDPFPVSEHLHVFVCDERLVPETAPESNLGRMRAMTGRLGLPPERVIGVPLGPPHGDPAEDYAAAIRSFFDLNGRLVLVLLGIGIDGHTASLFGADDLRRAEGRLALRVTRESGPARVSVTPAVLERAQRIVFLASGPDKSDVVTALLSEPRSLVAGRAVARAVQVELWYCLSSA